MKQYIQSSQFCPTRSWTRGLVKPCGACQRCPSSCAMSSQSRGATRPLPASCDETRGSVRNRSFLQKLKAKWTDMGFRSQPELSASDTSWCHLLVTREKSKVGQVPSSSSRQKAEQSLQGFWDGFYAHLGRLFYVFSFYNEILVADAQLWSPWCILCACICLSNTALCQSWKEGCDCKNINI